MESTPDKSALNAQTLTGPRYWKSLDDLLETPAFESWLHNEFPQGAAETKGLNRRQFVKIMGASFALAGFGMSGCRRPEQKIVPYSKQPENMIPGVPKYFASAMPTSTDAVPLAVETHMARPTKIEGNANFKPYGGATSTYAQASILDLYDPDRATQSIRFEGNTAKPLSPSEVKDLLTRTRETFAANEGEGLGILMDGSSSLSREQLLSDLAKAYPKAVIAEYEPVDVKAPERAAKALYGKPLRPHFHFDKAKRVLAFDADFTQCANGNIGYSRDFANARRVHSAKDAHKMSRLYMVESDFTTTGGMADHRVRLSASQIPAFMAAVAAALMRKRGNADASVIHALDAKAAKLEVKNKAEWIAACVEDLLAHRHQSLVVAGEHLPLEAQQLAYLMNEELEASGHTMEWLQLEDSAAGDLDTLAEAMRADRIQTLVIVGGNPAYDAPADLDWPKLQKRVPEVIRYGMAVDETSKASTVHIAATHYLESWNDARTLDGTLVPVQPMIMPLFEGLMELEVLARLAGAAVTDAYEIVLNTFSKRVSDADKKKAFEAFLHRGYLPKSGFPRVKASARAAAVEKAIARLSAATTEFGKDALEVRIVPSAQVFDGRYNNNGWLQELPEPMNKICWENSINISPRLAEELGFDPETVRWRPVSAVNANTHVDGRQVAPVGKLKLNGVTLEGPVNIQPGLANYTVTVAMGYGRRVVGRVGKGTGFDVFPALKSETGKTITGCTLEILEKTVDVANTQQHWSMEGRAIIREANADYYEKHPEFVDHMGMESHTPPVYGKERTKPLDWKVTNQPRGGSAYKTPEFTGPQQWGMSIDLNVCTGCNQCVIACQSENNIPIVGREQVIHGREMHWIRLDRYYSSGDVSQNAKQIPEDPQVSLQPMACVQCEMAPCEQVCPVNATVHDDQGLNVMAYNRCVGTRYCSNNCPYKVRRFNFFDWNKREIGHFYEGPLGPNKYKTEGGKLHEMQRNPDVTVRMRGVMEKCTYCQQRIESAKINQKAKARNSDDILVPDGTIKTACQQACPSDAIAFGDIADSNTEVYKIKQSDRDYSVLGYLNTRPRTTYLARLRNPNPKMPDYHTMPLSQMEYMQASGHGGDHGSTDAHGHASEGHHETPAHAPEDTHH